MTLPIHLTIKFYSSEECGERFCYHYSQIDGQADIPIYLSIYLSIYHESRHD